MTGKLVVGLTGGIGSGKTAVAEEFARLGATVIDSDAIAHELTAPGGGAIARVRELFGGEFIAPDGRMDRARMRDLVFSDAQARQRLEGLLHPMIRAESERRIAAAAGPYVVYVVPLLVETGSHRGRVARVLVVDCPEEIQIERVRRRSGISDEAVRSIVASQAPRATRLAAADDVISNSGTLDALHKQVLELHRKYVALAQS